MGLLFWGLILSTLVNADQTDTRLIGHSGPDRVAMIELYSSESCSSCPPADKWVGALINKPGLWKTFIPVVFHVDYWNYLEWKDGLSSRAMTQRQIDMSKTWSKPSVYTPGVVVNGEEWRDWSSRIIPGKSTPGMSLELQLSEAKPLEFEVQFNTPGNGKSDQKLRTHLALLGFGLETEVSSGENSGKKLKHEFVVLDWSEQTGSAGQKIQFKFKKPSQKYTRLAAVTWVENLKNPVPLQITGGYL